MTLAARTHAGPRVPALPVGIVIACVGAAIVLAWSRAAGVAHYANDPVSVIALGAASTTAAVLAVRAARAGERRLGRWLATTSISLACYLVLAAGAVWAVQMGSWLTAVIVALWGAAWIPPLLVAQLAALAAVQRERSSLSWILLGGTVLVTLGHAMVQVPQFPFDGVSTIAPEAWITQNSVLGLGLTALGGGLLLVVPTLLARAAARSVNPARTRLGIAALGAAFPVLVVIACVLLAIAREPGQVDPTVGSVGFILALCVGVTLSLIATVIAHRGNARPATVLGVARAAVGGFAAVLAIGVAIVAADALRDAGLAAVVVTCAGVAVAGVVVTWAVSTHVAGYLTDSNAAHETTPPPRIDALTAREHEVLDLLAEGASNAGIATELVISERTVDAHLRSIFTKLGLDADTTSNRRVVAARLWLDAHSTGGTAAR